MAAEHSFPVGGGEMGALIRAFDWSKTSLGPLDAWPQGLKAVTSFILLSPVPMVLLWGADGVMIYNDGYSIFAGGRHPASLGSKVREAWPEVAAFNSHVIEVGLAGGTLGYRDQEMTLHRNERPEQVWMDLDYSPVLDDRGTPAGVAVIVAETTKRVRAAQGIRESEIRFRALVNATSDVLYRMNADWTEMDALDGRGFLADAAEPTTNWMDMNLFAEDQPRIRRAIDEAIATKSPFQLDHRVRRVDGSAGWTFSRAIPLLDEQGEIREWFGAASDVSERYAAEQHLRLVINELNHRVKNNLAMIQAMAHQTFRGAQDVGEAQTRFAERLVALSQANDLLTGELGAGVSLRGVAGKAVSPHSPGIHRCRIGGPEVHLSSKTALSLSLAMHELATNALKHGAWSNDTGLVDLSWVVADGRLRIEWRESGGPPVVPPAKRGFGSRLIERGLAAEMGGTVAMRFEPDGLVCAIDAPLDVYAGAA